MSGSKDEHYVSPLHAMKNTSPWQTRLQQKLNKNV